jgi:hypothetical protein
MKFNDPEIQSRVLDLYAMHALDTTVARLSGVSRTTLWRMSKASEEGAPELQECDWGGIIKAYHEHKLDALDQHIEDVCQRMTHDAGHGQFVPVVHGGFAKFREDEYAMSLTTAQFKEQLAMDDEMRDLCGYPRVWEDRMLRVQNPKTGIFERVPLEQYIPPTLEAQNKVLGAFAPDVFGDRRKIDLQVSGGLGVSVGLPFGSKPPIEVGYVQPLIPEIEYNDPGPTGSEPVPAEPEIVPDDLDEDDGDEASPAGVSSVVQAAPVSPDDTFDPEQRALLGRLRAVPSPLEAQKADAEKALRKRIAAGDPDVDPRRVGYGPQPHGFKVV